MTPTRKALFLLCSLAIAVRAAHAAGIDRRGVPGKDVVPFHPGQPPRGWAP